MTRDLNIDLDSILIEDDASRFRETLTDKQLKPRYVGNTLPTGDNAMTDADKEAADAMLSPRRPGFVEAISKILSQK